MDWVACHTVVWKHAFKSSECTVVLCVEMVLRMWAFIKATNPLLPRLLYFFVVVTCISVIVCWMEYVSLVDRHLFGCTFVCQPPKTCSYTIALLALWLCWHVWHPKKPDVVIYGENTEKYICTVSVSNNWWLLSQLYSNVLVCLLKD